MSDIFPLTPGPLAGSIRRQAGGFPSRHASRGA